MFKALILQAQHNLSDARMEFMIRDRLSWMRFLRFDLGGPTPDENTIPLFRNKLTETGTLKRVMKAFDWQLQKKGYIPMSGQIVDASLVPAPKQRNTGVEKEAIKAGKTAREIWPDEPHKAAQKDTDARWTLKIGGKIRYRPDGTPLPQIAMPVAKPWRRLHLTRIPKRRRRVPYHLAYRRSRHRQTPHNLLDRQMFIKISPPNLPNTIHPDHLPENLRSSQKALGRVLTSFVRWVEIGRDFRPSGDHCCKRIYRQSSQNWYNANWQTALGATQPVRSDLTPCSGCWA
ncbi:Transposase [Acidiphilium sp. PM]|nr:Transposase [Acidiphilium sp. PM]